MKQTKIGLTLISLLIIISVGYAFSITGGPAAQRQRQVDQRKLNYMRDVAYQVFDYYFQKEQLPESLGDTKSGRAGMVQDEFTLDQLTYKILSYNSFEICTDFVAEVPGNKKTSYSDAWEVINAPHAAGNDCFTFRIHN